MSIQAFTEALVVAIVAAEIYAWLPWASERLVGLVANRLPEPSNRRYLEEWLGELDARPGGVAKIMFALQVFLSAGSLLEELPPPMSPQDEVESAQKPESTAVPVPKVTLPSVTVPVFGGRIRALTTRDASLIGRFATRTGEDWEHDMADAVDELSEMLHEDRLEDYEGRVAVLPAGEPLAGFSIYGHKPLGTMDEFADAAYIGLLGINGPYRAAQPDTDLRLDTLLLADALMQIERKWGQPEMPLIWTLAHRDAKHWSKVLSRHHFWPLKQSGQENAGPYRVYLRPDGLQWSRGFAPQFVEALSTLGD